MEKRKKDEMDDNLSHTPYPIPHTYPLYLLSRISTLLPLALSKLPLTPTLLLLLPLLFLRASSRSAGCSPLARAYRFRMSVRLTTPERRPAMCWPGSAAALMTGLEARGWKGGLATCWYGWGKVVWGGIRTAGWDCRSGLAGTVGEGEGGSTIHILLWGRGVRKEGVVEK